MSIMQIELVPVEEVTIGMLVLVTDGPAGRWFAAVKDYEDGYGVRTFHLFGYASRTLAWHQHMEIGR
jgi:hypothetical protein